MRAIRTFFLVVLILGLSTAVLIFVAGIVVTMGDSAKFGVDGSNVFLDWIKAAFRWSIERSRNFYIGAAVVTVIIGIIISIRAILNADVEARVNYAKQYGSKCNYGSSMSQVDQNVFQASMNRINKGGKFDDPNVFKSKK